MSLFPFANHHDKSAGQMQFHCGWALISPKRPTMLRRLQAPSVCSYAGSFMLLKDSALLAIEGVGCGALGLISARNAWIRHQLGVLIDESPLLMPCPGTFDVRQDQFPNFFNGNEIHSSTNEVEELQTARSYNVVKAACAFYLQQCRVFHVAERLCVAGDRRCGVALWHYDTCHGFSLRWIQLSLTMMFLAVAI